jgi:hypothetical protein
MGSLLKKSQNGLLELCYRSGGGNDAATKPKGNAQAEATAIGNRDEFLDLIDESLATFAVTVQGMVDFFDITPDQRELSLYWVGSQPVISGGHTRPQIHARQTATPAA